ncbi:MAG: hypothetical protein ACO1RT_14340, partial [Planctomycetaceae bacterium]
MQILATSDEIVPPSLPLRAQSDETTADVSWQQGMRRAIRSVAELRRRLGLPPGDAASQAAESGFPTFVTLEF